MTRPDMLLAEFIDATLQRYARSAAFRSALLAELPDAPPTETWICPPSHKHAATDTCYGYHRCRCGPCRQRSSDRQKYQRRQKAIATWNERKSA